MDARQAATAAPIARACARGRATRRRRPVAPVGARDRRTAGCR